MDIIERNAKIIATIIVFIWFEILLMTILERISILIGIDTNFAGIVLALIASTVLYKIFEEKLNHAIQLSYLFYKLHKDIKSYKNESIH